MEKTRAELFGHEEATRVIEDLESEGFKVIDVATVGTTLTVHLDNPVSLERAFLSVMNTEDPPKSNKIKPQLVSSSGF